MALTATRPGISAPIEVVAATPPSEPRPPRRRGYFVQSLAFTRTRIGLGLVGVVAAVAIFGTFLARHNTVQFVGLDFSTPSRHLWAGTDYLGRDVMSRFLNGGHFILIMSLLGTILGVGSGTIVGLAAGYAGSRLDAIFMRLIDLLMCFPGLVLALLLITVIGGHPWVIVCVVGITFMPHVARVVRTATIQTRESDFVKYAEATGVPLRRILVHEILPSVAAPLTVEFGLKCTQAIALIAGLDFLGLGVGPPAADWGLMIQENQSGLVDNPMSIMLPVIAIVVLCIGANLITDGIGHAIAGADRKVDG
jgi:peptide/nickel transport system permease protein